MKMVNKKSAAAPDGLMAGTVPQGGIAEALERFKTEHALSGKGQIATMIFASRLARRAGLPIDVATGIVTEGQGQVRGLSRGAVQEVLADYKVTRILAEEGGRTSRGSLGNIRAFLEFLNELNAEAPLDLGSIEAWWVEQAMVFFNAKPFVLRFEPGQSMRSVIRDLLAQAKRRQREGAGTMFVGAMLQHLVGAKLSLAMPDENIEHNGFSVADAPTGRSGDFEIGGASIHVTTTPGEAVVRKCEANLLAGRHPIVITFSEMIPATDAFAAVRGIQDKVDVIDAEQFIVTNLYELGGFKTEERRVTVKSLVAKYNQIVAATETDPSLKISTD